MSPTHYRLAARLAKALQHQGHALERSELLTVLLASSPVVKEHWASTLLDTVLDKRFTIDNLHIGLQCWRYPFPAAHEAVVVLDIETTGLGDNSEITEIACVRVDGQQRTVFSELVNPGVPIPKSITRLTGITDQDVQNAPDVYQVLERAIPLLEGAVLVIQNASFDLSYLKPRLKRLGYHCNQPVVDTLVWAKKALPALPKRGLDALAWAFDIDDIKQRHRALGDVELTLHVASQMYYMLSAGTPKSVTLL